MAATMTMSGLVASAASYYVDSSGGNDGNDGLKPESAWQSLVRVNGAALAPGDEVLFKRGGLWRGVLAPRSGEPGKPVRYAEYGDGPLPILQGSVAADVPADWEEVRPGIWRTLPARLADLQPLETDAATKPWGRHQEGGAAVAISNAAIGVADAGAGLDLVGEVVSPHLKFIRDNAGRESRNRGEG